MTVGELLSILENYDKETTVILSKDGEGNDYSPVSDTGTYLYIPLSTWSGEIVDPEDWDEPEPPVGSVQAVVLWPVN